MTEERARRMVLIARATLVVTVVLISGLVLAVVALDQPGWLLCFVAPAALSCVAVQLMALRAEAGFDDLRFWRPLDQQQSERPSVPRN
jgi:hypothetical protein